MLSACHSRFSRGFSGAVVVHFKLTLAALLLEAAFGYPQIVYRVVRHPVVWVGALIGGLDRKLNNASRLNGVIAVCIFLALAVLPTLWLPWSLGLWLSAALLAQRSLWEHVAAVADGLDRSLPEGRRAVARIVGRDPENLDEHAVARAAIESLAENFSDGVVAPAFWCAVLGAPGIAAYKAINTADSMIGHRTPRHAAFGWAAARLDDLVNLPASRLAAWWIVLAAATLPSTSGRMAWQAVWRDASHHRSPNAGWPEAAMAGALGLRLAGPRVYNAVRVEDGWMGSGRSEATAADIRRALLLYRLACALQIAFVAACVLAAAGRHVIIHG
jgi:adenosylcobinamide-phosphate synthase